MWSPTINVYVEYLPFLLCMSLIFMMITIILYIIIRLVHHVFMLCILCIPVSMS